VDRHHVDEIIRPDADAPAVPIEEPDIVASVARENAVPNMRVALHNRMMGMRSAAREQTRRRC
jgi:hypothetical protein